MADPIDDLKVTPPEKPVDDDLVLKRVSFSNPILLFLIVLLPVVLGLYFNLTYHPEVAPEEPVAAVTSPVARPPSEFVGRGIGSIQRGDSGKMGKIDNGYDMEASAPAAVKPACGFDSFVGRRPDTIVEAELKATGRPYRVLKPGSPMTMDFSEQRINLDLDDQGVIRRVWCG